MQLFFFTKLLAVQLSSLEVSPVGVWFLLAVPHWLWRLRKTPLTPCSPCRKLLHARSHLCIITSTHLILFSTRHHLLHNAGPNEHALICTRCCSSSKQLKKARPSGAITQPPMPLLIRRKRSYSHTHLSHKSFTSSNYLCWIVEFPFARIPADVSTDIRRSICSQTVPISPTPAAAVHTVPWWVSTTCGALGVCACRCWEPAWAAAWTPARASSLWHFWPFPALHPLQWSPSRPSEPDEAESEVHDGATHSFWCFTQWLMWWNNSWGVCIYSPCLCG